nr:MAG TPA: hypothetical protein [Caudoviricetes sp.]DAN54133.1 MAG TPA: hypothetical protein [Caudoviricetes sp.]DAP43562.1 MAG TPA: hypothetical protein [Caudoviricetes sp.]
MLTTRRRWQYKRRKNRPGYLYYISSPGGSQREKSAGPWPRKRR